jgi:two-component system, OmpR family, alkaline phosphatase synthesis response regulator PhoP
MAENDIRRKVLIVDDEPNVRRLSHTILSKKFDVFEAENGVQAIEMAKTKKPDIILMDMMMPKMDGLTACHAIRNDPGTKSIPVIMVTAIGFELNVKLSQQMGANGYLTKPFSPQELLEKTAQVLTDPSGL